jgi:hypothetical protein
MCKKKNANEMAKDPATYLKWCMYVYVRIIGGRPKKREKRKA